MNLSGCGAGSSSNSRSGMSSLLNIHNCVQTSLENDYFKEKLTEFYKENKKLQEQLNKLKTENCELKSTEGKKIIAPQSDGSSQTLEETSNKQSKTSLPSNNSLHSSSSTTKCSVCSHTSSRKPPPGGKSVNTRNRQCQTDEKQAPKTIQPTAQPTVSVDKDAYNKQNKVIIFILRYQKSVCSN
jgi:hypothetical protein